MKCLVSGATGFIGSSLCSQLLDRGDEVIALSKRGQPLAGGAPTIPLDLAAAMPDATLLRGVDVVFHLAGIAHQNARASAYRELNELATLRLARLAAAAGVACFVFPSSVKAMGQARDDGERPAREGGAPAGTLRRAQGGGGETPEVVVLPRAAAGGVPTAARVL